MVREADRQKCVCVGVPNSCVGLYWHEIVLMHCQFTPKGERCSVLCIMPPVWEIFLAMVEGGIEPIWRRYGGKTCVAIRV